MARFKNIMAFSTMIFATCMVVSSTVSAKPVVKQSSTHYMHVEGTSVLPYVSYEVSAFNNCQVIEIPGGSLYHVESVETLTPGTKTPVVAVANSPPFIASI